MEKTETNRRKNGTRKTRIGKKPSLYCGVGEVCKAVCNNAVKAIANNRPYGSMEENVDHNASDQEKKSRLELLGM